MAEVTEQDRAKARELVAARIKAVWSNAFSLGTANEQADELDRIARALAAAREQGKADSYSLVAQAANVKGVLDCTDFERGPVVRRVLGSLPVTADGCVCGEGAELFTPNGLRAECDIRVTGPTIFVADTMTREVVSYHPSLVYSTRAAAESARPTP